MTRLSFRFTIAAVCLTVLTFALASTASAICFISSCNASCSTDAELQNDINCSGGTGITLTNGADLDMRGHNIACTSSCPSAAVSMTGTSSIVKNATTDQVMISGAYSSALVDCGSKSGSRVTGIRLESSASSGTAATALKNCSKADGNVLIGNLNYASFGIDTGGVTNNDLIVDNYLDKWGTAIRVAGTKTIAIEGNVVSVRTISGSQPVGIWDALGSTGVMTIQNNTLFGNPLTVGGIPSGDLMILAGNWGSFANFCDPVSLACADCIAAGYCTDPVAPIVRP